MAKPDRVPRVAFLTNMIPPYRLSLFERLATEFEFHVLYSGHESNRPGWEYAAQALRRARVKRSWGIAIRRPVRAKGRVYDVRYIHINPGYLLDLLRLRPDVVLSSGLGFRTVVALLYCTLFRTPLWVWWEGTVHTERRAKLSQRVLRKMIAPRIRHWISCGQSTTSYLETLGVPAARTVEAQLYHDEQPFLGAPEPAIMLAPRPVILCVGQLIERKGVALLLDAVARLQAEGLHFSTLIVGDGPEGDELRRRAEAHGLRHIHFHPAVQMSGLLAVYRSADVFVFPTLEDVWGVVVNEALWAGLPVLASRYAGCAEELLRQDSTFDPLDENDFATKLRRAINGELAAPDLSRLRTSDEVADLLVGALRSVLPARGAREVPISIG